MFGTQFSKKITRIAQAKRKDINLLVTVTDSCFREESRLGFGTYDGSYSI